MNDVPIKLNTYPSMATKGDWELITYSGLVYFGLEINCPGTFQIVASTPGADSAYSEVFSITTNEGCYLLAITLSKSSVLIYEVFNAHILTQQESGDELIKCSYKIVDSKNENVYIDTIQELTSQEIEFGLHMETHGIKCLIVECYDFYYGFILSNNFQVFVSSVNEYKITLSSDEVGNI